MEQIHARLRSLLLTVLLAASCSVAWAEGPPAARTVMLTGWLHVEDLSFRHTTVEVELQGVVWQVPVSRTGRFDIELPTDQQAIVRFAHPGHLTKEVLVDTHHAHDVGPGKRPHGIRFAVVLEEEREMIGFHYDGPVGAIAFEQGGGCPAAERTYKLAPGSVAKPMVF